MRLWLRIGLACLALTELTVGAWQLFLPRSFYEDAPAPGHAWVALVPPYSEHLLRDVGALNLALAVVAAVAAVTVNRLMAATTLLAYLVSSIPHLVFHVLHLEDFPHDEAIAQTVALAIGVGLPLALLGAVVDPRSQPARLCGGSSLPDCDPSFDHALVPRRGKTAAADEGEASGGLNGWCTR